MYSYSLYVTSSSHLSGKLYRWSFFFFLEEDWATVIWDLMKNSSFFIRVSLWKNFLRQQIPGLVTWLPWTQGCHCLIPPTSLEQPTRFGAPESAREPSVCTGESPKTRKNSVLEKGGAWVHVCVCVFLGKPPSPTGILIGCFPFFPFSPFLY